MPHFFISSSQIISDIIEIKGELLHHLKDSLRIRKGELIICTDASIPVKYTVKIKDIGRTTLTGEIVEKKYREEEWPYIIHLVQAIPGGSKFDLIIQKSTELGVHIITPVVSERCVVRIKREKIPSKMNRWQKIALEAAQQSERWEIPRINPPVVLREFISSYNPEGLNLLLWEREKRHHIKDILRGFTRETHLPTSITVMVGPEGGFSEAEVTLITSRGFIPVSLGNLILRTETASLAILSILQYELGVGPR